LAWLHGGEENRKGESEESNEANSDSIRVQLRFVGSTHDFSDLALPYPFPNDFVSAGFLLMDHDVWDNSVNHAAGHLTFWESSVVPEPSTLILVSVSIGAFGLARWCRKKA
jgi:hypothetical protein